MDSEEVVDDILVHFGQSAVDVDPDDTDDALVHFGKKGMKWGVRKDKGSSSSKPSGPQKVTTYEKGKKLKTKGGGGHSAHPDAIRARTLGQVGKKSGLKSLSDKELQDYAKRLNLEQNVKRLNYSDKSPPKKFVLRLLGQTGNQVASEGAKTASAAGVKKLMKAAAVAA